MFGGANYAFWNVRMESYIASIGYDAWMFEENGYTFPKGPLTDAAYKVGYENNAKAMSASLYGLANNEFTKVMHYEGAK